MIHIPVNIYDRDLRHWALSLSSKADKDEEIEADLIWKVCGCCVWDFKNDFQIAKIKISPEEIALIKQNRYFESQNKEVSARFRDICLRCQIVIDRRIDDMATCSMHYLELSDELDDPAFLVRSFEVRQIKCLYSNDFLEKTLAVICKNEFTPVWIRNIVQRLSVNVGVSSQWIDKLLLIYKNYSFSDYGAERDLYMLEHDFQRIDEVTLHRKMAVSYETEADEIIEAREPNTYYPTIEQILQKSYNEIYKIKEIFPDEYSRIHEKLVLAKRENMEMLTRVGFKHHYEPSLSFREYLRKDYVPGLYFSNPYGIFKELLGVPYYSADPFFIEKFKNEYSPKYKTLFDAFPPVRSNDVGNIIGKASSEEAISLSTHKHLRVYLLYQLRMLLNTYRLEVQELDVNNIASFLEQYKSPYVSEQELFIWSKSICAIINGEEILGSYALVPLIEKIMHNIAECKIGDLTELHEEKQLEQTFGQFLGKLKDYMCHEKYRELNYVLLDQMDVNLRNEMMHGNAVPMLVIQHSPYLLYVAVKLYFEGDAFLFNRV